MKWMKHRALRYGIALWIPLAVTSTTAYARDDAPPTAHGTPIQKRMSDADWAALFDRHTPLVDRQRTLAGIEQSPHLGDTLYHLKDSR